MALARHCIQSTEHTLLHTPLEAEGHESHRARMFQSSLALHRAQLCPSTEICPPSSNCHQMVFTLNPTVSLALSRQLGTKTKIIFNPRKAAQIKT